MPLPYAEWVCYGCKKGHTRREAVEERYSLGLYAGRYHDRCWATSGYRDEGPSGFDPMDAGESYEEE
jgi:hypothetical protein